MMSQAAPVLDRLVRGLDYFAFALSRLGMWVFVPLLAALVFYAVLMRYVFGVAFMEGMESQEFLLLMIFITGWPNCTAKRDHITLHILEEKMGLGGRIFAKALAGVCGALFFGFLAWRAAFMARDMYRYEDAGQFLEIPYWPLAALMALCAFCVALQFPLMALRDIAHGAPVSHHIAPEV